MYDGARHDVCASAATPPFPMPDTRRPLDTLAVTSMLVLCGLWGFQQVAVKLAAHGVSLVMQGAIRSAIAFALLLAWAALRRIRLFERDGTLVPGVLAGILFGTEFAMIYAGLAHTTAARMVVFLYLAPCLTALGLAWFVPGERLTPLQWSGVAIAFVGIVFAFGDGFSTHGASTWLGDALGIAAAFGWSATTVLIRATSLARVTAAKTLAWQLGVSAPLMLAASLALGEPGIVELTGTALASLAYPGGDRRLRELSHVVLAADPLPREPALRVLVRDAAVRRRVRPSRARRSAVTRLPPRGGAGRRRDCARQPACAAPGAGLTRPSPAATDRRTIRPHPP